MKLITVLLFAFAIAPSQGYNILCIFPVPTKSHNILGKGIVHSLLQAGHKVTLATPYHDKKEIKSLKYVELTSILQLIDGIDMTKPEVLTLSFMSEFSKNVSVMTAENEQLREVLVKEQFDAVVTEFFFSDLPAGFAAVQQAPWIIFSSVSISPVLEHLVDEVRSVSTVPSVMSDNIAPMNYLERLINTALASFMLLWSWWERSSDIYENLYSSLAEARGIELQPLSSAMYNASIVVLNSHPSIAPAFALPPNVIEVAGFHIDEDIPPLPKDLQELLDSSTNGVVYFSMGSVVKSSALPEDIKQGIIQVLGELPYTVLWKFEEKIEGLPKNVHTRAWMPQSSILAHKNVKLFITHSGLLSTVEAIYHGVPLLAIPVFGDQPSNAERSVKAGFALAVPYKENVVPKLRDALNKMISDDRYYNRAKYLSKLFRNRPISPKKMIANYIEVAIESKGAYHLRSYSRFYTWYQRMMLDQLAGILLVLYLIYHILRRVATKLFGKTTKKENLEKRKSKKNK